MLAVPVRRIEPIGQVLLLTVRESESKPVQCRQGARRLAAVLLALAATASAAAQSVGSLNRIGSGARAAGMANTFIAVSDDGTAASWNPAGLAQLRRPEASVVVDTIKRSFELSGFLTPDNHARYGNRASAVTTSGLDFVSLAVPFTCARR